MRHRVIWGRFLIRLGRFIQSLAVMVMRPDDLMEFSRQHYDRQESVSGWARDDLVDSGLYPQETILLEKLPSTKGRLLLLGVGGGREAIPLAQEGFAVTGVDVVPKMVEMAKENAVRHGLKIKGMVQEISKLDVPESTYDTVWLSVAMYSCVPTRKKRIEMLRRIGRAIRPGGHFVCQFCWDRRKPPSHKAELVRKAFAFLTLGNRWYETGDMLSANVEFIHAFSSEEDLRCEFDKGGFEVMFLHKEDVRGGAVLRKS